MPGFLVQTITLIGYLSRQVNESPPSYLARTAHTPSCLLFPARGLSRLQQIWFTELAVLCGLGLNGQGWWPLECGDLWVFPKYGPQMALMSGVQILWQTPEMSETQSNCCPSPLLPVLVFVGMWWGDMRQHRPLIFISSELTVPCLFLAEVFLMFKSVPRCLWLISAAWLQVFK